jgi:hypothetical protein
MLLKNKIIIFVTNFLINETKLFLVSQFKKKLNLFCPIYVSVSFHHLLGF